MVSAGIPVHNALNFLTHEENPILKEGVEEIVRMVHRGVLLSRAIRELPRLFPPLAADMIQAGETTGRLDSVLDDLANLLERSTRLQKKLVAALTYPCLLMALTFVIVGVLVVFVFPREAEMATSLGAETPALTAALLAVAKIAGNPIIIGLVVLALAALAITWPRFGRPIYQRYLKSFVDEHVLDIPVLGPILAKTAYARMLSAMANLVKAGMGIGPGMNVVASLSQNRDIEKRFRDFMSQVTQGVPMGEAAKLVFPPLVCQMFRVGEEQGQLDVLLARTARMYEDEVESSLITLTALLEPLALLFMGVVVGLVVVATSLPTLNLLQNI